MRNPNTGLRVVCDVKMEQRIYPYTKKEVSINRELLWAMNSD